jgi:gamma-butyrobetaine dioxygenase
VTGVPRDSISGGKPGEVHSIVLAPGGQQVDITWVAPTQRLSYHSYWFRQYLIDEQRFAGVAADWTDGANFHAQQEFASERDEIASAELSADGTELVVRWADGAEVRLPTEDIWSLSFQEDIATAIEPRVWGPGDPFPGHDFAAIMTLEDAFFDLLVDFARWGILQIFDAPPEPDTVIRIANRIGTLCPSHLGDTFEVKPKDDPDHIGEVCAEIPLHIDLVYRQDPPPVQLLHAIKQVEEGGENEFVDVRRIIELLNPDDLSLLRSTPVDFVADSSRVHFRGRHPILKLDVDRRFEGVFYNQYKIVIPPTTPSGFYFAFERFRHLIRSPEHLCPVKLPEGSVIIFDNRRVLHGRRRFVSASRHLVGAFANGDDFRSRLRVMWRERQVAPARVGP